MEQSPSEQRLVTVDVERRGYGRRYTWLPVDTLTRSGFVIDCTNSYLRPEHFDFQPGDMVRWRDNGRQIQANITDVERDGLIVRVSVGEATVLPPEFFAP